MRVESSVEVRTDLLRRRGAVQAGRAHGTRGSASVRTRSGTIGASGARPREAPQNSRARLVGRPRQRVLVLLAAGVQAVFMGTAHAQPTAVQPEPGVNEASTTAHETFSVGYTVTIEPDNPTVARVRWDLAGVDELERVRLSVDDGFSDFAASGTLERRDRDLLWWPGGPYAHLTYRVLLNHRRSPNKGYDSYATGDWVVSRTSNLFPRAAALFRPDVESAPESRARLLFHLPPRWEAATVMPREGASSFVVESAGSFDHPRGWLMLGHFQRYDVEAGGTSITIVAAPAVTHQLQPIGQLIARALPEMRKLFGRMPEHLLIITAPDPMWRGGLSGEDSFYIHSDRPLRTPDKSSPYLHELFHVAAPFRPARDGRWITEGLAELYSVEIQRRLGLIDQAAVDRALRLFSRHGLWGHDFTRTSDSALRNNSAPLVLYALDQQIRISSGGVRSLDTAVKEMAASGGTVSTARFLHGVEGAAGGSLDAFFRRHVYGGEQPAVAGVGG